VWRNGRANAHDPKGRAGKVTAGLAERNGSLPPGGWLKVTCGLGSAPGPTLGNEYGRTTFLIGHKVWKISDYVGFLSKIAFFSLWPTHFSGDLPSSETPAAPPHWSQGECAIEPPPLSRLPLVEITVIIPQSYTDCINSRRHGPTGHGEQCSSTGEPCRSCRRVYIHTSDLYGRVASDVRHQFQSPQSGRSSEQTQRYRETRPLSTDRPAALSVLLRRRSAANSQLFWHETRKVNRCWHSATCEPLYRREFDGFRTRFRARPSVLHRRAQMVLCHANSIRRMQFPISDLYWPITRIAFYSTCTVKATFHDTVSAIIVAEVQNSAFFHIPINLPLEFGIIIRVGFGM